MTDEQLLGLTMSDPTPAEVKTAWRALAMRLHPDKGGSSDEFRVAAAAYKRLLERAEKPRDCSSCDGLGKRVTTSGFFTVTHRCNTCHGSGEVRR